MSFLECTQLLPSVHQAQLSTWEKDSVCSCASTHVCMYTLQLSCSIHLISDVYFSEHSRALRRLATSFCPLCGRLTWISRERNVCTNICWFCPILITLTFVIGNWCPLQCLESEGCDYVCLPSNVLCTVDCLCSQCSDQLSPIDQCQPLYVAIIPVIITLFTSYTVRFCSQHLSLGCVVALVLQNPFTPTMWGIRIHTCILTGYVCIPLLLSVLLVGAHVLLEPVENNTPYWFHNHCCIAMLYNTTTSLSFTHSHGCMWTELSYYYITDIDTADWNYLASGSYWHTQS